MLSLFGGAISANDTFTITVPQIKMFVIVACVLIILYLISSITTNGISQKVFDDNKDKIDTTQPKFKLVKAHLIGSSILLGIVLIFLGFFLYRSRHINLVN